MRPSAPQGNPGHPRPQYQARKDLDGERQRFETPHAEGFLFPANIYLDAGFGDKDPVSSPPYQTRALTGMKDKS